MIALGNIKKLILDGIDLKALSVNGVEVWRSYTNQVPLSINADGSIYNDGLGYKNGYRVRSGGAEATQTNATITGFIKVNAGDVVRISGCVFSWEWGTNTAINVADSSFTNLGQLVGNSIGYGIFTDVDLKTTYGKDSVIQETDNVWKWIVPPAEWGIAYIRITASNGLPSTSSTIVGADLIVTVNEEIS